mmetsp:Transcript_33486/g.103734  ORF Transcript_33486/g.103734 Transcript_33486/m.103734 type:complete len:276 (+) Transcript_33486:213-1040(+)
MRRLRGQRERLRRRGGRVRDAEELHLEDDRRARRHAPGPALLSVRVGELRLEAAGLPHLHRRRADVQRSDVAVGAAHERLLGDVVERRAVGQRRGVLETRDLAAPRRRAVARAANRLQHAAVAGDVDRVHRGHRAAERARRHRAAHSRLERRRDAAAALAPTRAMRAARALCGRRVLDPCTTGRASAPAEAKRWSSASRVQRGTGRSAGGQYRSGAQHGIDCSSALSSAQSTRARFAAAPRRAGRPRAWTRDQPADDCLHETSHGGRGSIESHVL